MRTIVTLLAVLPAIFALQELPAQDLRQTQADSYTRYELLEPGSGGFRIIYEVSATTPGATSYFNTLRKGSEHRVDAVYDLFSGQELKWRIVSGAEARAAGFRQADPDTDYLQVFLARPVPEGGESRLRIDKTYWDKGSYSAADEEIVFSRSLSIERNAVVLPPDYEVVECNYPSQVMTEAGGRLRLSFMNVGPSAVPYRIRARKCPGMKGEVQEKDRHPWPDFYPQPQGRDKSRARLDYSFPERAFQDREIVYFLQPPETHSFRLYHDYTENREGVDRYLNVVRAGSKASNPSARILDTGQELVVETLRGEEISRRGIDPGEEINAETEIVVIWFDPVKKGQSVRLRIEETYTDPNRYLLYNGELIWDRSFGRNRNTVVLPQGWYLTANAIPATIDETEDGAIRLHYVNGQPDNIDVFLRARKRN